MAHKGRPAGPEKTDLCHSDVRNFLIREHVQNITTVRRKTASENNQWHTWASRPKKNIIWKKKCCWNMVTEMYPPYRTKKKGPAKLVRWWFCIQNHHWTNEARQFFLESFNQWLTTSLRIADGIHFSSLLTFTSIYQLKGKNNTNTLTRWYKKFNEVLYFITHPDKFYILWNRG